jgi:acetoacetyl-CoA synthetase
MSSPLLLFKSGTDTPPFFITHGLGGTVTELCELVGHIQTSHPIYGIQWRGLDGSEVPDSSIEDMAQFFIDAIQRVHPNGPYLLAGLSLGGMIMLEVAARLSGQGESAALLAFIDTYPAPRYWPLGGWIESLIRRIKLHLWTLAKMPPSKSIPFLIKLCRNFSMHLRSRRGGSPQPQLSILDEDPPALQQLRISAIQAFDQYEPKYYPGKLTFLKAEIMTRFPSNPAKVWSKLCSKLEIYGFPCDHVGMISTHADKVAAQLSLCIEKAAGSSN